MKEENKAWMTPEEDARALLKKTENHTTWFPLVAAIVFGGAFATAHWRGDDPTLAVGFALLVVLIGIAVEILNTKALIIQIEVVRMARDREEGEKRLEQLRNRRDLADQVELDTPQDYS